MAAPKRAVGPKSDKLWRDALMVAVKREMAGGKSRKLAKLADALVDRALDGDVAALREIGDRLDGKPTQGVELGGTEGGAIEVKDVSMIEVARRLAFVLASAAHEKPLKLEAAKAPAET